MARKKRRSRKRSNPRKRRFLVGASRRRSNPRRRRTRRRGNPGVFGLPLMDIAMAVGGAVAGLYGGSKLAETQVFQDVTKGDDTNQALAQVAAGVAGAGGAYALTKSAPLALGVAAGLAGFAGFMFLQPDPAPAASPTPPGQPQPTAGLYRGGRELGELTLGCAGGSCGDDDMAPVYDDDDDDDDD